MEKETHSSSDSERFIDSVRDAEEETGLPTRGIFAGDTLRGVTSVHSLDSAARSAALGYWIDSEWAGNGYASAAARQMARLAFRTLDIDTLTISCRADNRASRAVAEKAGFVCTGIDTSKPWKDSDDECEVAHYQLVKTA